MGSESFLIAKYEVCEECYSLKGNGSSALLPWYLYSASLPLGCSWVISFDNNWIFFCVTISCAVGRGCLLWLGQSLGKTWLAFDLLHFFFFFTCFILYPKAKLACYSKYLSKFVKLSSGHRMGKSQFSFQFQKAMTKNVQITLKLYSFHILGGNAQNPLS